MQLLMLYVLIVYPGGWYLQGNNLYKYFPVKKTWQKAKEHCVSNNAELAYIPNQELNEFVYKNLLQHINPKNGWYIKLTLFITRNVENIRESRASVCHASRISLKITGCNTTDDMIGCWLLDSSDPDVMYVNILITT